MRRALFAAAALACAPAMAWESTCHTYADPTLEPAALASQASAACAPSAGPNTARQRWVGALDEHRQLFESTREQAGLPAALSSTWKLRVFTSSATVAIAGQPMPTLQPVAFEAATRVQARALSIGELAQLPDFSYALWDWATGHELCPLDGAGVIPEDCHDFASHMGPVNANHFLPQAQRYYARYHGLALARAGQCKAMRDALAAAGGRFDAFPAECENEALALEAIGQHYLQDAWSMGHTWQRWGSANLSEFPSSGDDQRDRAVLTALVAGLIHGSRGVLQQGTAWAGYDVNDALCAPNPGVLLRLQDGSDARAIGDDYLALLTAPGEYGGQARQLQSCAASGASEVYEAAGRNHGAPGAIAPGLSSVDPTGAACFGQRATNASMRVGAAVQMKILGQQVDLGLDSRLVSWMVPKVARANGEVAVRPGLRNQFRLDLQRVVSIARLVAKKEPSGTQLADGRIGDFLGAKPNGGYAGLASYVEPSLPWPATPDPGQPAGDRATALARVFHRAHADDWCRSIGAAQLTALKAHAADGSLDAEGKAAACEACAEIASRHLRIGAAGAYDATKEPLCHFLAPGGAFVYQPAGASSDPVQLARGWCGCP